MFAGRALAVGATKTFDLEDDLVGLNSGKITAELHKTAEVKNLAHLLRQRP